MANTLYSREANFSSATTARGSEVKAEFDLVVAAFDAVETITNGLRTDVDNLGLGIPPGWNTALNSVGMYAADTSSSDATYQAVIDDATGNALFDGFSIELHVNTANAGAATLNIVGSTNGNVPINKIKGSIYGELEAGDMDPRDPVMLTFITDKWVLRKSSSGAQTGLLVPFCGSVVPDGFLEPYGQAISRTANADLYSVIGTTYGIGDGSTTFNLPDARGQFFTGNDSLFGGDATSDPALPIKRGDVVGGDPNAILRGNWLIKT